MSESFRNQAFLAGEQAPQGRSSAGTESFYPLAKKEGQERKTDKTRRVKKISFRRIGVAFNSLEEIRQEVEHGLPILKQYLGKFIPKFNIFYSSAKQGSENTEAYMEMDEITEVPATKENENVLKKSLDEFNEAWLECYENGVQPDFGNYKFGTTVSNKTTQIYFYDLYPHVNSFESPTRKLTIEEIIFNTIKDYLKEMGVTYSKDDFPKTLEKLKNLRQPVKLNQ